MCIVLEGHETMHVDCLNLTTYEDERTYLCVDQLVHFDYDLRYTRIRYERMIPEYVPHSPFNHMLGLLIMSYKSSVKPTITNTERMLSSDDDWKIVRHRCMPAIQNERHSYEETMMSK